MINHQLKRMGTLVLALGLALAGCKGDQGDTGPQGATGPGGSSVGSITGTIVQSGTNAGVAGAVVTTVPLGIASAATGADGAFTISNVPLGTYGLTVSGTGITELTIPNVVVVANTATAVGAKAVTYSPMTITVTPPIPAGFGKAVPLSATVTGATGTLTYTWSQVTGPTVGAFDVATSATPTFTTGTLEAMIAAGKLRNLAAPLATDRSGLLALTAQHIGESTYGLKVEVSDGKYTQAKTFSLVTALVSAGQLSIDPTNVAAGPTASVPTKVMVIGTTGTVDAAGWTLDKAGASGSTAVLEGATTKNPWFVPDVPGVYVLKNGAAVVATVNASDWRGAPSAACGPCHNSLAAVKANTEAKFKAWNNSAHGNHFFKYFVYDAAGNLVPKADPLATTAVVPTATPGVNWTLTAPFRPITTFEFAITGGEGGHYSESCMTCHTVGMNKAVANGGVDDVVGYVFPNMGLDSDPALPAQDLTRWNAFPQGVRDRAGMQCESCHGPLTAHAASGDAKPKGFYDSGTCGVCHDRGGSHDRYHLWSNSRHADVALAQGEGVSVDATTLAESLNTNCGRCHSAQGFVAWSKTGFALANVPADASVTLATVQPVTCMACHDPHTTGLRVDESQPVTTTSGYTVSGAGIGQLCVICHSTRRGLRNDANPATTYSLPHPGAQSDLFFGQNVFFFGPLTDGTTTSTHAYVLEGTCAGCHMEKTLAVEGLVPRNTNHSFRVSANVCAKCHAGASFSGLKERTEAALLALSAELAAAAQRSIPSAAGFKATLPKPAGQNCNLRATFTAVARPGTVAIGMPAAAGHGTGFTFTWAADVAYTILAADNTTVDCDPVTAGTQPIAADIGPVTITANTGQGVVLDANLTDLLGTTVLIPASGDLFKAWWNMALVEEDLSFGAHNPGFAQDVLATSKLKAAAIPASP